MQRFIGHLRARPRLVSTFAFGALIALLLPSTIAAATRALVGWNVAVWLFLALIIAMMRRADHQRLRRAAIAHAEGAAMVTLAAVCAAVASLAAIVVELSAVKAEGQLLLPHLLFAIVTLVGSWLLLPTLFAEAYASLYYAGEQTGKPNGGLEFPGGESEPDYGDFMYFAVTIAATAQTSDVGISTRAMRRWVMAQSLLSFAFNTALLALAINIVAGLL
jgi:uncharacterized membrane protein